jgi:hypothetical protein
MFVCLDNTLGKNVWQGQQGSAVTISDYYAQTEPNINVALATNGSIADASSFYSTSFLPEAAINGDKGESISYGRVDSMWMASAVPEWLSVTFPEESWIGRMDLISMRDDYNVLRDPTLEDQVSLYGLKDFELYYYENGDWVLLESVTNNTDAWYQFSFPPVLTTAIKINVISTYHSTYARVVEFEAWGWA